MDLPYFPEMSNNFKGYNGGKDFGGHKYIIGIWSRTIVIIWLVGTVYLTVIPFFITIAIIKIMNMIIISSNYI